MYIFLLHRLIHKVNRIVWYIQQPHYGAEIYSIGYLFCKQLLMKWSETHKSILIIIIFYYYLSFSWEKYVFEVKNKAMGGETQGS